MFSKKTDYKVTYHEPVKEPSLEERSNSAHASAGFAIDTFRRAAGDLSRAADEQDAVSALAIEESQRLFALAEDAQEAGDHYRSVSERISDLIGL